MKKLSLILAASAFAAVPAMASDVGGEVMPSCTITGAGGAVAFTDMDNYGQATDVAVGAIDVFCNEPSTINFKSTNGHLLNTSATADGPQSQTVLESATIPGFNAAVNYRFAFDSIVNNVNQFPVSWDTSAMVPGAVFGIPVDPVNATGETLTYGTMANANGFPALAGTYADTLEITITATGF